MATDAQDTGFLSRWSRRKALVREGMPVVEKTPAPEAALVVPAQAEVPAAALKAPLTETAETAETIEPAPTLADVAALTRESDFTRFVGRSVQPDVKNAALGKLFTDPHFNVMDGLDVYIDDYGKPDPLPPGMLRQMLQAHVLGLFDDEDKANSETGTDPASLAAAADTAPAAPTAQETAPSPADQPDGAAAPPTELAADENTDLQLQPDDGAGRAGAAPGAGENAGRADRRA